MKDSVEPNEGTSSPMSVESNSHADEKMAQQSDMIVTVETRLNQIREYIKTTLLMMESLKKSSDPRAKTQHEKLGKMVEDLYDSEIKLSKLLNQYRTQGNENGNVCDNNGGEPSERENNVHLYKKMEESQKKLIQLQEHQSQLVGMQKAMTESLNEARQLRNSLAVLDSQESSSNASTETEAQMVALVGKLSQLQAKKQNMDQLIAELNTTKLTERCNNEAKSIREKELELEGLKNQLAHLKTLMDNATKSKEGNNEQEVLEQHENGESDKNQDMASDDDDLSAAIKPRMDEIQAVTRELKEQAALLQAARAEVAALKQSYNLRTNQNTATNSPSSSTAPPPLNDFMIDHQSSKNETYQDIPDCQSNKSKDENVRKEKSRMSSANESSKIDWRNRRGSNSAHSRTNNSNFLWPSGSAGDTQEHVIDDSLIENLDVGLHVPIDNGYTGNWISYPPVVPPPQGAISKAEYYRQLFLGSQAHQIQMMNSTMQNCCQMLHSQQREMQLMQKTIADLQAQVRQLQLPGNNKRNKRNSYENGLDTEGSFNCGSSNVDSYTNFATTVDSSSMIGTSQQQMSNKVPVKSKSNCPDNLRSSSIRNIPSKPVDSTLELSTNTSLSTNLVTFDINDSPSKEKQNYSSDTLHRMKSNLLDSLSTNQLQEEEDDESLKTDTNVHVKDENICEEENSFYRMLFTKDTTSSTKKDTPYQFERLSDELKEALYSFVMANINRSDFLLFVFKKLRSISDDEYLRLCLLKSLCKLENTQNQLNSLTEATERSISESNSSQCSEGDYEINAQVDTTNDSQSLSTEMLVPPQPKSTSSPIFSHSNYQMIETMSLIHDTTSCSSLSPSTSEAEQVKPKVRQMSEKDITIGNNEDLNVTKNTEELSNIVSCNSDGGEEEKVIHVDDNSLLQENNLVVLYINKKSE